MNKAYFTNGSDINKEMAFRTSFTDVLDKGFVRKDPFGGESAEYYNPFTKVNRLPELKESLQKASIDSQTGGAGTAGTALVPVYVDPNWVNRTVKETPLLTMFARRAVRGATYDYTPLTAKGGANWEFENANTPDSEDTWDRVSVPMKFLRIKGRVTGVAIAEMRGFIDPEQLDLGVKSAAMFEALEDCIVNGDKDTNPEEFDGLIHSIATNTTNMSSALPTLADIRAELATTYNNNGAPTLAVTDKSTHGYVKSLLIDLQRNVTNPSQGMLGFGIIGAFEFDELMFITDKFMPTTSGSRRILFLDQRYIFLGVLQDLTYEEKFSEHDNYPYMMKWYGALVVTHEAACSQIYGIA